MRLVSVTASLMHIPLKGHLSLTVRSRSYGWGYLIPCPQITAWFIERSVLLSKSSRNAEGQTAAFDKFIPGKSFRDREMESYMTSCGDFLSRGLL